MYVQSELHLCFYYIFKEKKEEKMYKNKRSNLRAYVIKKLSSNRLNQPLYGPAFCYSKEKCLIFGIFGLCLSLFY